MSTSSPPKIPLRIRSSNPMTEVRVSDARYRDVQLPGNSGNVDVELEPGVYQVAFRQAKGWHNELVVLSPDQPQPEPVQEPQALRERAIVGETDPDDGLSPAHSERQCEVRILLSESHEDAADSDDATAIQDLQDVRSLLIASDSTLVEVDPDGPGGSPRQRRAPVKPGHWFLRVDAGDSGREPIELPLVACPGWQTQVRLHLDRSSRPTRWDPARTIVSLRRLAVGGASEARVNQTRGALAALSGRRSLAGRSFHDMIRGLLADKFEDPMLGVYVGHLLSCSTPADFELLDEVVRNLSSLVQGSGSASTGLPFRHPDVEALKLRSRVVRGQAGFDDVASFDAPPMLAASWNVLKEACVRRPELIPRGSLTAEFAARSFVSGPWRGWTRPARLMARGTGAERSLGTADPFAAVSPMSSLASYVARAIAPAFDDNDATTPPTFDRQCTLIRTALAYRTLRDWYRRTSAQVDAAATDTTPLVDALTSSGAEMLDPAERAVAAALRPVAPDEAHQSVFDAVRLASSRGEQRVAIASEISAHIGLPTATVEDAAESLVRKLIVQTRAAHLPSPERFPMTIPKLIIPYDPDFLGDGFTVPMPALSESLRAHAFADGAAVPYTHFSLVMHARRRVAIVAANNIDAARKVQVAGGLTWHMDERIGEFQLGPEVYADNQLDRGHMVRREDVLWGSVPEARRANESTFFYANAAPQHQNFNQDEWVTLEDWVLDRATEFSYRLCVFTGPVLRDNDPTLGDLPPNLRSVFRTAGTAQIPAGFWKVIVLRDATAGGDDLAVVAFAMRQTEMWNDKQGRKLLELKVHQVTLEAIEEWTGLDFGELSHADELRWSDERMRLRDAGTDLEWPLIRSGQDIVFTGSARRLRGARVARSSTKRVFGERGGGALETSADASNGCDCNQSRGDGFDARAAIEALNRDVVRLTSLLADDPRNDAGGQPAAATRSVAESGARTVTAESPSVATAGAEQRGRDVVAATPAAMQARMAEFLRWTAAQRNIARGIEQPANARDLKRIIGGDDVPPGGFPSCVCIGTATQWQCTGAVVAPRVVLTAAHCGGAITRVMIGGNAVAPFVDADGRVVAVRKVEVHPAYRRGPFHENDISLLILADDANVPPAKIGTAEQLRAAPDVQLVGFGYNDPARPLGFGVKRQVVVPMAPIIGVEDDADLSALEQLLGFHGAYEFVAGRKGLGIDSCNGDSGGPAYIRSDQNFMLAGLTSRATREAALPCGDGGIYVRPGKFLDWINQTLSKAGLPPL